MNISIEQTRNEYKCSCGLMIKKAIIQEHVFSDEHYKQIQIHSRENIINYYLNKCYIDNSNAKTKTKKNINQIIQKKENIKDSSILLSYDHLQD